MALKYSGDVTRLVDLDEVRLTQGPSFGALWLVWSLARQLGLADALGQDRPGRLALWQVCSRVLEQGSRLSAVRLASRCAAGPLLDLEIFTDDDQYRNLDGLTREQVRIGDRLATLQTREDLRNAWLELHRRASPESSARRLEEGVDRLSLKDWVRLRVRGRRIEVVIEEAARAEALRLDGRYALKTDVPTGRADAQTIHERYRDLKWVEYAFRTCKTGHLEFRPVWVRRERRTRAHALVVMLAYRIARHLQQAWQNLDVTVEEGLRELSALCITQLKVRK